MNTNITERDKKLLYGLGIIVIIALFFIGGIRPLHKAIAEKDEKIEEEQETHDIIQTKIMYTSVVNTYVEEANKNVDAKSARYYKMMDASQVDRLFTKYALSNKLTIADLRITMPEAPALFLPYPYSLSKQLQDKRVEEAAAEAAAAEALEEENSKSKKKAKSEKTDVVEENKFDVDALTGEATDTSGSGVYIVDVGLDVYGSEKGAVKLLDELAANESIHINSYSWSDDVDSIIGFNSDGSLYSKKGSKALSISLSLMMYDPDSYIPPEDNATE
jgi:hypothetical protein